MPTVGVAIVSYNTRELLHACLDSLRACKLPLRVVVVDNGSRDDSPHMVRSCFAEVELIEAGANLGFAGGTNRGLQALMAAERPDYLLMLNSDTEVCAGAIEALVAFLEAHPRVGAVGPRLLNPDRTTQPAAFRFPTLAMTAIDLFPPGEVLPGRLYGSWWHGRYAEEQYDEPFAIDHPLGACILTRPAVLEEVGLLDEGYFMYSEEVDWSLRVRRAGWAIWQVPQARVVHVGGASTRQLRARMLVALYTSRLRFFRRNYGERAAARHAAIIRAGALRHILLAWCDHARGRLQHAELRERLWAYGEILRQC